MKCPILAALLILTLATMVPVARADDLTAANAISAKPVFPTPIIWVGIEPPTTSESQDLMRAVSLFETNGSKAGFAALDDFASRNPSSAWTASVNLHLGDYYRSIGRYSKAAEMWTSAWQLTKDGKDAKCRDVAVSASTSRLRLLQSLGDRKSVV